MPPAPKAKKTVAVASSRDSSLLPDVKVKKRKPRRNESYGSYIYKILKQVHPEYGISRRSMSTLESFVNDMFYRIAQEASHLVTISKKKVMSAREIETATKLAVPGELSRHAVSEGYKALQKYASNQKIKF